MSQRIYFYAAACAVIAMCVEMLASAQSIDTPQTRMRPIGSGSAVDRYRGADDPTPSAAFRETAYQASTSPNQQSFVRQTNGAENPFRTSTNASVRQTVMLQGQGPVAPGLSGGNYERPANMNPDAAGSLAPPSYPPSSLPGSVSPSGPLPSSPGPVATTPPANHPLPSNPSVYNSPGASASVLAPNSSDLAPIAQPQLNNAFATIDNCNCISGPSTYSAASGIGCGVAPCGYAAPVAYTAPQTYVAPPATVAPQVALPGTAPLAIPSIASSAPVPSLITLGQQTFPVEVGQGLWGQPVAYVPGQGIRNWVRYFFP
tara:strand:+ start:54145 stop:55092 length:948 start_codon:yes stop_codon:yes gene_type:complete